MTTQPNNPRCIHCRFCMLFDATCAHPVNDFAPVDYDAPVCQLYEPENVPD